MSEAEKEGIITQSPAKRVSQIKRPEAKREFLTFEEMQKLALAPCENEEVKEAFLFACFTGLRRSDVQALTWANVQEGYLVLRQKKTQDFLRILISEDAQEILEGRKMRKFLFKIPLGEGRYLRSWFANAGITKRAHFHLSRHTFAVNALKFGADIYTVSKLLGHKDLRSTLVYAKVLDEAKDRVIRSFPRLNKMRLAK